MAPASAIASPMFFQWLPGGVSLPAAAPCQLQILPSWMTVCLGCRLPRAFQTSGSTSVTRSILPSAVWPSALSLMRPAK